MVRFAPGGHTKATPLETVALVRELAREFDDARIARILNRQGRRSGRGLAFTKESVTSLRGKNRIPMAPKPEPRDEREGPFTLDDAAPRYLIFDRDSIFSRAVVGFVRSMGTKPRRTAYRSPWQNSIAERWIGGCRRELFDHIIVFNELHAVRLARSYIAYFHEDRTHLGLDKDAPYGRPITQRPSPIAMVAARLRVGGLHSRYEWREAA